MKGLNSLLAQYINRGKHRKLVFQELQKSPGTSAEIYHRLHAKDRGHILRTLQELTSLGLVKTIKNKDNTKTYTLTQQARKFSSEEKSV